MTHHLTLMCKGKQYLQLNQASNIANELLL